MRPYGVLAAIVMAASITLGIAYCCVACSPSVPTPQQQAAVAFDAAEQKACVDNAEGGAGKAALQAEIDKCRDAVKARRAK